ncbi:MAG: DNA repair protein RecN [Dysgonamonadaceae bacterium]|nr:DNA repair protein RecN [Dysgonamonadaceae bacterium]
MLRSLSIQDYALISRLEIGFNKGFSVLTGETGAGKSIILGALALILGQRADTKSIRQGADKCIIEGLFDIAPYGLQDLFAQHDWEYDAQQCIIRREIHTSGKSRAFINDTPVALTDLKELVGRLIDVHSQHQNLLLGDDRFQLRVIDTLAGHPELFAQYKTTYHQYLALQKQLATLKRETENDQEEEEYLRFQVQQLEDANLKAGEQAELEQEAETLSNLETIKAHLFHIAQILSDDERGIVQHLKTALSTALSLAKTYPTAQETADRLQSAYLDLKDLATETAAHQESLEYDPQRLHTLNERLDLLFSLQKKHRVTSVEELIAIRQAMEEKLLAVDHSGEQIARLQKDCEKLFAQTLDLARQITHVRHHAAQQFEAALTRKVQPLSMPHMRFACRIDPKTHPDDTGIDTVTFLFSANKNISMMPLSQIASGGEIARLMLGVKALVAGAMALPTIIFDEIDTGVSGETADKMGEIMQQLAGLMQVIAITHLPQIAAKGDAHYLVFKNDTEDATQTHIRLLDTDDRICHIAHMLSGSVLTEASIANAKELLKQ